MSQSKPKARKFRDGYSRPKLTKTDKINNEESREKLKKALSNYLKIDKEQLEKLPVGSHVRYFSYDPKTGTRKFRLGGFIHKKEGFPKYLILSNGSITWSVQVKNTIFFRKMKAEEIQAEYEEEIQAKDNKIFKLKKQVSALKDEIRKLRRLLASNK